MATPKKGAAKRPRSTQKYIRNLAFVPASVRLTNVAKRIELKPRGTRGDLHPLEKGQERDPAVVANVGRMIEVISEAEAFKVMDKQTVNQQAYHPAIAHLKNPNPHGPEMKFAGTDWETQERTVTVATFDDHDPTRSARSQAFVHRATGEAPQEQEVPGSTKSHARDAEEAALQASDEIARAKNVEGPRAGLGGFKFVD